MKRTLLFILVLALMSSCMTSKKITSELDLHAGSMVDSIAVTHMQVDSASWSTTIDSSMLQTTHYEVLRDSVGRPVMDEQGAPVTYVVQRDTLWRVVTIDKGASSTIVQHDTIQVTQRDTVIVQAQYSEKSKTGGSSVHSLIIWLIVLGVIVGTLFVLTKFKNLIR